MFFEKIRKKVKKLIFNQGEGVGVCNPAGFSNIYNFLRVFFSLGIFPSKYGIIQSKNPVKIPHGAYKTRDFQKIQKI